MDYDSEGILLKLVRVLRSIKAEGINPSSLTLLNLFFIRMQSS